MIRVLIADDHALVRRGLTGLLSRHQDIAVVGEVERADAVLDAVRSAQPDVLLLDISMPGPTFLEVLQQLRLHQPRLRTLVVSGHSEVLYARRAIRSGAAGYISKQRAEDELVQALRVVGRGGHYVSAELAQDLASDLAGGNKPAHELLSNREYEVMLLLAAGHTVSQIGERLHLSVKTVSTHRTNLLDKMKLTSNAELVQYVQAFGLST
jgi:two-component system invasion response regulator UvrY